MSYKNEVIFYSGPRFFWPMSTKEPCMVCRSTHLSSCAFQGPGANGLQAGTSLQMTNTSTSAIQVFQDTARGPCLGAVELRLSTPYGLRLALLQDISNERMSI